MDIAWSQVLGDVVTQILRVVLPFLIILVLKWILELGAQLKEEKPELEALLDYSARMAVYAAEQIYGAGQGNEKKAYAIDCVQNYLCERGVNVNIAIIAEAIESAVWEYLNQFEEDEDEEAPKGFTKVVGFIPEETEETAEE